MSDLTRKLENAATILKQKYYDRSQVTEITTDSLISIFKEVDIFGSPPDIAKRLNDLKYKLRPFVWSEGFAVESQYGRIGWLIIMNLKDWIKRHTRNELLNDRTRFDRDLIVDMFSYVELTKEEEHLLEDYTHARDQSIQAEEHLQKVKKRLAEM